MSNLDLYGQLERLKQLHSSATLTDAEFGAAKAQMLVSLPARRIEASQSAAQVAPARRSIWKLIGWCLVWTCVFDEAGNLLLISFVTIVDPDASDTTYLDLFDKITYPVLLVALVLSIILIAARVLPGAKRPV